MSQDDFDIISWSYFQLYSLDNICVQPNATGVGSFAPMSPRIGSAARQDTGNRGGGGGGGGGGGSAGRGRGRGQRDMGIIGEYQAIA